MDTPTIRLEDSIVSGPNVFANRLSNMDKLTDEEIYTIIKTSYDIFLSSSINDPCFDFLKQSTRFITILSQVITEIELTLEQRIYCNGMIYKELSNTDNAYVQRVYYILGMLVNQTMVNKIMATSTEKIFAIYLAVLRESSFSQKDNVARLNFSILCASSSTMTIQHITDIYCALFNTIDEIKELFLLTIKDTYIFNSKEEWINSEVLQIASNMNYAILSLLESLPIAKLEPILTEYAHIILMEDLTEDDVRFSFRSMDLRSFPNIKLIVDKLNSIDELYVI